MNCKDHHLPELELSTGQVREALQCILHTILFIRSPGPVKPSQVECEGFPVTYTRIAATPRHHNARPSIENDLDQKVNQAIESFLRSLSQIGPELLSGCLTLSFLERRASRQLFGLMSHEEKVIFEQWIVRIVVNNTPRPVGNESAAFIERQRIEDMADSMVRAALAKIFEIVSGSVDHIPPVQYEFEIACTKRPDDRENMYSRVANMPPILNLSS